MKRMDLFEFLLRCLALAVVACGVMWSVDTLDAQDKPASRPAVAAVAPTAEKVDFLRDVQPIFMSRCVECHGPRQQKGGLRVDVMADMFSQQDSGKAAVVPGDAAGSHLLALVREDEPGEVMPPKGKPLSKGQIETLTRWIAEGAAWPAEAAAGAIIETDHWAFQRIVEPALPKVADGAWVKHPIDRFVLATLEARGIRPSPEADRHTLVRRLSYDLTGLPPSPAEVDVFVHDRAVDAYDKLVDRLLASPHFGERWGRHWLDMARYADSDGYEKDNPRLNAWRYRDWVIDAINRDVPFDQFTIEQLAGDLLPGATPMQKLATAFHRQTLTNTEGGADQEEFRNEAVFDRTETTSAIWMGMTMTCARCHAHKYDPITQREYFELFAFFNTANEAGFEVPQSDEAVAEHQRAMAAHEAKLSEAQAKLDEARRSLEPAIEAWEKEKAAKLAAATDPLRYEPIRLISAKAASGAVITPQEDGSLLVSGTQPDKDKYTVIIEAPAAPLTGLRLEALTHATLPSTGPGRTPHGNFVLTELRTFTSDDRAFKKHERFTFATAEASFAQGTFPPANALVAGDRTGWAISPQMGKDHHITFFTSEPLRFGAQVAAADADGKAVAKADANVDSKADAKNKTAGKYIQIVLDQQYGGGHTIGRFRIQTMTGFDALKALPKPLVDALKVAPDKRTIPQRDLIASHVLSLDANAGKLVAALEALKKNPPKSPMMTVPVIAQGKRATRLLHRGDFLQPAQPVSSGVLAVVRRVHPLTPRATAAKVAVSAGALAVEGDRLDLARWLMDANHPLTPRVSVNHIWAQLMGRGLVATVNDFGLRGEAPTHPQLLDWLAHHWPRDMKWSRKALIKAIVTSATYRQASHHRPELYEIDPTNRLLARQNRLRVEAEIVRDLHLAAAGLLANKVGGPSVFPPLPAGVAELSYANNFQWKVSTGEDRYRRGMYTFFKRTSPHPTLISFDCPDSNTTKVRRDVSNTPIQALITLNNEVFVEAAQAMARRVLVEVEGDDTARLTHALRLCIARPPASAEVAAFAGLLEKARLHYQANADDARKLTARHPVKDVSAAENAAWVATVRVIMNLDEFIMRE